MVRDELQRWSPKSQIPAAREISGGMGMYLVVAARLGRGTDGGWMGRMDVKVGRLDGRPGEREAGPDE